MMSKIALLPSLNRNVAHAVDHNGTGIIAYASQASIYILDIGKQPVVVFDNKTICNAHRGKITSVSFCKTNTDLLASIGDDSLLKIWNLSKATCVINIEVLTYCHIMEWLHGSESIVLYPAECGYIIKWDFKSKRSKKIKGGSDLYVSVIASNPLSPDLVAIGHNNGAIGVLSVGKEVLLYKLRVHSTEVTNLSWSPLQPDILLSTSHDLSARFWKMGEDKPLWTYYASQRNKYEDKKPQKFFGICHPENPNTMIIARTRGDVGVVSLGENQKPKFEAYPGESCKGVNTMFTCSVDCPSGKKHILFLFDVYKLISWDIQDKTMVVAIPQVLNSIYDLSISPVTSDMLAVSNGDGILRIWKFASEDSNLDIISIYIHFKLKIMSGAWHPSEENIIAYGTDDGKVGVIDVNKKKLLYTFETHHNDPVYSVSWGPMLKSLPDDAFEDKFHIYSCGGCAVYINALHAPREKALDFDDIIERPSGIDSSEKSYSEISWKLDYSCLAVGSHKGFIDLYSKDAVFLTRFWVQLRTVECICWHPHYTYASSGESVLNSWFASAGIEADIHVFDAAEALERKEEKVIRRSTKKLVGHKKRVVSLCWSPHIDGHLVSGSKDGTAQVWDVCSGAMIANYSSHLDVVLAVQWSTLDPDVIFSGGLDSSLRIWRISEQTNKAPPDQSNVRKRMKCAKRPGDRGNVPSLEDSENKGNVPLFRKEGVPSSDINEVSYKVESPSLNVESNLTESQCMVKTERCEIGKVLKSAKRRATYFGAEGSSGKSDTTETKEKTAKKKHNRKSFSTFPMFNDPEFSKEEDLENCIRLADIISAQMQEENADSVKDGLSFLTGKDALKFGLFTNQLTALKMLEAQAECFRAEENLDSAYYLQMMSCDIESMLRDAAEKEMLSPLLVSMAPSVSYSFWLEMCEKFAVQLTSTRPQLSVMYFIACGKIYEAINLLIQKGVIIEALGLAKARLPESDPLIQHLLGLTAKKFLLSSRFGAAAECYIARNEPGRAAKLLFSSSNPNAIRVAAYISYKFNLKEEGDEYSFLCLEKCLMQCDWASFKSLAVQEKNMQIYSTLVRVHECFYTHVRQLKKEEGILLKNLFDNSEERAKFWSGKTSLAFEKSFFEYVYDVLLNENILPTEEESLWNLHNTLKNMSNKRKNSEIPNEAHISVAINATQYIILIMTGSYELALKHLLNIFEVSCNVVFLARIIFFLFFPLDFYWHKDKKTVVYERSNSGDIKTHNNDIISQFQKNYILFGKNFVRQKEESLNNVISKEELLDLPAVVNKVQNILYVKRAEDFFLPYFAVNYINDLKRLLSKKDVQIKCCKNGSWVQTITAEQLIGDKIYKNACDIENNDGKPPETIHNKGMSAEVQSLIQTVLKEAEEKARFLLESKNLSDNQASTESNRCEATKNNTSDELTQAVYEEAEEKSEYLLEVAKESNLKEYFASPKGNKSRAPQNDASDEFIQSVLQGAEEKSMLEAEKKSKNMRGNHISEESDKCETSQNKISELDMCSNHSSACSEGDENVVEKEEIIDYDKESKDVVSSVDNRIKNHYQATSNIKIENSMSKSKTNMNSQEILSQNISHEYCVQNIIPFHDILALMTHIVCKDEYALLYYLRELMQNLELAVAAKTCAKKRVVASELQKVKLISSVENDVQNVDHFEENEMIADSSSIKNGNFGCTESNIIDNCLAEKEHNLSNEENGQNIECISNDDKDTDGPSNEPNNVSSLDKVSEGIVEKLRVQHANVAEILSVLQARSEGISYPNPFDAASNVVEICNIVLEKVQCEEAKDKLSKFLCEIKLWIEKFFVAKQTYMNL